MSLTTSTTTPARMALLVVAMSFALASAAQAGVVRTWVSFLTGNDSNTVSNCPVTAPCKSINAAYTVTNSGGEIIAMDSGGFGSGITITMPISIIGVLDAEVQVPAGATGITVNAGSGNLVVLKNITFNGANFGTNTGISVTSGNLILENSTLKYLATGMTVAANMKLDIENTKIIGNTTGISTHGTGTNFDSFTVYGPTQVRITGGSVLDNTTGFLMNNPGNDNFQYFPTVLIASPITTNTAGNSTLVSCNGATTQTCNAGTYGFTTQNAGQIH